MYIYIFIFLFFLKNVNTIILDKIAVNDVMKRAKAATKQQVYVNMGVIRAGQV